MANSSVRLKLLIDTKARRVLFAEAGKDCVDFLIYILSLPVANVISLVRKQGMVGSLANLYESIENLDESYIQPNQTKDKLLKPVYPVTGYSVPLLAISNTRNKSFRWPYNTSHAECAKYLTDDPSTICPKCKQQMTLAMQYVAPTPVPQQGYGVGGGFVKGVVTYMVMDDLVVTPMSTITSITLLNKFNVKNVGVLEEKVVYLGMTEAVKLLKASLETKNVLTHVFLDGFELSSLGKAKPYTIPRYR